MNGNPTWLECNTLHVVIDHKTMIYITITRTLSQRQARYENFIVDFPNFENICWPEAQQGKANNSLDGWISKITEAKMLKTH